MSEKKKTILVVDDDEMNLQMAKFILDKEIDAEVMVAGSGYMCIELLQQRVMPDLILLDIQMPRMDGIMTLEKIRDRKEWKDIPVIFLTASADKGTVIRAGRLKVDGYIKKPFLPTDLVDRVNKVFAEKSAAAPVADKASGKTTADPLADPNLAAIFAELDSLGK